MEAIRDARIRAGLTQTQLAEAAGTTQAHISRIEAGSVTPSLEMLTEVATACGCSLKIILEHAPRKRSGKR